MAAENGFLIAGKVYEVPGLDSLTLDEAELLYEQSGLAQEDFAQEADETDEEHEARVAKMVRHPGFLGALARIAFQRGNPTVKPGQVRVILGKVNRIELFSTLGQAEEEPDEIPLVLTSEPNESSPSGSRESESSTKDSPESSGSGLENGSGGPAGEVVNIGTSRSATSSISAPEPSVASVPST